MEKKTNVEEFELIFKEKITGEEGDMMNAIEERVLRLREAFFKCTSDSEIEAIYSIIEKDFEDTWSEHGEIFKGMMKERISVDVITKDVKEKSELTKEEVEKESCSRVYVELLVRSMFRMSWGMSEEVKVLKLRWEEKYPDFNL